MTRKELIDLFEQEPSLLVFVLRNRVYFIGNLDFCENKLSEYGFNFSREEKFIVV